MSAPQPKQSRPERLAASKNDEEASVGSTESAASLQRELKRVKAERDLAIQQGREWQLQVATLKAELDKERGSYDRIVASKSTDREKEIRAEVMSEWAKSEAGWKERVRNERLLRLSYERVLTSLGFAPNRIASDIVRVSRPQPMSEDPGDYRTMNILGVEANLLAQPASTKKGLFAYSMEDIMEGVNNDRARPGLPPLKPGVVQKPDEFFNVTDSYNSRGKKDLLKTLSQV